MSQLVLNNCYVSYSVHLPLLSDIEKSFQFLCENILKIYMTLNNAEFIILHTMNTLTDFFFRSRPCTDQCAVVPSARREWL